MRVFLVIFAFDVVFCGLQSSDFIFLFIELVLRELGVLIRVLTLGLKVNYFGGVHVHFLLIGDCMDRRWMSLLKCLFNLLLVECFAIDDKLPAYISIALFLRDLPLI